MMKANSCELAFLSLWGAFLRTLGPFITRFGLDCSPDLLAIYPNPRRCCDAEPHLIPFCLKHPYGNGFSDPNHLSRFARQNQHVFLPLCRDGYYPNTNPPIMT